jgi:MarR family transcriptional regulator, transcriptional regulator for hemolysin
MSATTKAPEAQAPAPPVANLCWLLARASQSLTDELTAALEDEVGVSPRAHCVLSTAMTGAFTQTELAHAVGLDKTTMVVTVDELELAGLAMRQPSPTDRRARVIVVTPAGRRKVEEAKAVTERVQKQALAALAASERKALLGGLERFLERER